MQHNLNVPIDQQTGNIYHCCELLSFKMVMNHSEHPNSPSTSKSSNYTDTSLLTSDTKNWSLGNHWICVQWCTVWILVGVIKEGSLVAQCTKHSSFNAPQKY